MSNINSGTMSAQSVYGSAVSGINVADKNIAEMMNNAEKGIASELDMMKLNMAVSQRTTLMSLFSNVIKAMTDTEKQIANKI